jgi:myo-inositol-1(or 4)-monophosphatase
MSVEFGYTPAVAISDQERDAFVQFARSAVRAAGEVILPHFRSGVQVTNKLENGGFDPVTLADQAGERAIREAIERTYPEHGIFGEEYGFQAGNGLTWVIDPIDGTRAFMTGMLHWGVLLALFDGESPVIGAMYQPYTDELFSGDGTSAWLERGGQRESLATEQQGQFRQLSRASKLTKMGGDCYLFGMLAMGSLDLGVEAGLKPYDIQALMPIVQGAGGVITGWDGGNPSMGGTVLASATPALHVEAMALLQGG